MAGVENVVLKAYIMEREDKAQSALRSTKTLIDYVIIIME
jgi:hypothetical protein